MRKIRSMEDDELLRLQRRQHNEKVQSTLSKHGQSSPSTNRNEQSAQSANRHYTSPAQSGRSFERSAFKAMSSLELEWITMWYDTFVQHQQLQLWSKFEALSIGQKRAVLLDITERPMSSSSQSDDPSWQEWERSISVVSKVQLQDHESLEEKRLGEAHSQTSFYMMKQGELLSPYREIIWWLCYKGNLQGQQHILQKIDQLGIAAKKLLLLRLNGAEKFTPLHFSQQLTIVVDQQKVVDWDRIAAQLNAIDQLTPQRVQQELVQRDDRFSMQQGKVETQSQARTRLISQDTQYAHTETENYRQTSIDGISILTQEQSAEELDYSFDDEQMSIQEQLEQESKNDDRSLSINPSLDTNNRISLLEYISSAACISVFLSKLLQKGTATIKQLDFIDLCLNIPVTASLKQRSAKREKQMINYAFSSQQQLFEFLLQALAHNLYYYGFQKRDVKYTALLRALNLLRPQAVLTEKNIKDTLQAQIE